MPIEGAIHLRSHSIPLTQKLKPCQMCKWDLFKTDIPNKSTIIFLITVIMIIIPDLKRKHTVAKLNLISELKHVVDGQWYV